MKVHHIGIKVSQLEKNIELYSKLGCHQVSSITVDEIQSNRIVFLQNQIQCVELIEPLNENEHLSFQRRISPHLLWGRERWGYCQSIQRSENRKDIYKTYCGTCFRKSWSCFRLLAKWLVYWTYSVRGLTKMKEVSTAACIGSNQSLRKHGG